MLINENASQAKIKTSMKKMLRRVKSGDSIYFYYNGHGVPVPSLNNEPFMLASNTEPDFVADESFFALKNIYAQLSASKADKIVAIVDSCFSGVTDGKAVLKGVAATKMVAKSVEFDKNRMVVMSAGKGNQYSNGYDKKAHRLFSFYVMKNIIEGDSDIKTLFKDTKAQTYDTSLEEYGDVRAQEPTIEGNFRLSL
ncbi:protein containing Caspase domain [Sulfurimonas gotlandica GD1]|uniref:Protein containing Caspase domain n=1 Tax=Sulfurimonas gotlandica (strain DSM 19862 / JCM 16533 / GD1) TaxID=929558 RepID=H1FVT9_SULGG|nr:caspase family protein [Sulfurimonas gotlandica]EHP29137.1 protein containing Caspase domain [Sulfurimonas gotlandica GD1]